MPLEPAATSRHHKETWLNFNLADEAASIPIVDALMSGAIIEPAKSTTMAQQVVPHFRNDDGIETIRVGVKEFMCIGATPPFDHPHVYLDMGADSEAVCPYCSARYVHDAAVAPGSAEPANCVWTLEAAE